MPVWFLWSNSVLKKYTNWILTQITIDFYKFWTSKIITIIVQNRLLSTTGYKRICQFSLPAETVHHIRLPLRLSGISCFLPRLLCMENGFLQGMFVWFSFMPKVSAGAESHGQSLQETNFHGWSSRQEARDHGQSERKPNSCKRSWTVWAEARYDGQSLQEAKISGLIYTLCQGTICWACCLL